MASVDRVPSEDGSQMPCVNPAPSEDSSLEAEFLCPCCYELMVNPTTLQCGHSFCRICLARWFNSTHETNRKRECMECRQRWDGHPKVNTTLRNTIQKLFPVKLAERVTALEAEGSTKRELDQFEEGAIMRPESRFTPQLRLHQRVDFTWLVIISGTFFIGWTISWWMFGESTDLRQKPVAKWTVGEVSLWLGEVGPWAKQYVTPIFHQADIDGQLLLALSEEDVDQMLPELPTLQLRALHMALSSIQQYGQKPPTDIWEYTKLHPRKTAFMVSLRPMPRLILLASLLLDYNDSFLPLIHVSCPRIEGIEDLYLYTAKLPPPTFGQWLEFLGWFILCPYMVGASILWRCTEGLLSLLSVSMCIMLFGSEAINVFSLYTRRAPYDDMPLKKIYEHIFRQDLPFVIIVSFFPSIIFTIFLYYKLYVVPLRMISNLLHTLRNPGRPDNRPFYQFLYDRDIELING